LHPWTRWDIKGRKMLKPKKGYAGTVLKAIAAVILAVVAYVGLQYGTMLRDMARAADVYSQGDLEGALAIYEDIENRVRAHGAIRLIPASDRQTLLLNQARLLYALRRYDEAADRLSREDEISGAATDGRFFLLRGNIGVRRTLAEYRKSPQERGGSLLAIDQSQLAQAMNLLSEGLLIAGDSLREALELNPNDWDTKYNFEYVDNLRKSVQSSAQDQMKMLEEGEQPPTEALPPELIG
jgi:tetratricopeptide (TPR) repeat protein